MQTGIYLLHDIKAGTHGQPLHFENNVEAMREIEQAVKNKDTKISKYPADYNLLEVGTFDSLSGEILIYPERKVLTNLSSFVQ